MIEFPRQADSAVEKYYFFAEASGARAGNALELWYGPKADRADDLQNRDGQPVAGKIDSRTRYLAAAAE